MKICDYDHLLLYAKGWYQRGNVIEDVKKILGHRCGIDPKHMPNRDVWEQLVSAFLEYCDDECEIGGLLLEMFRPLAGEGEPLSFWSDLSTFERMIHLILMRLGNVKIIGAEGKAILCLGEPDPNILPLSENAKKAKP